MSLLPRFCATALRAAGAAALLPSLAAAQQASPVEEVVVFGRALELLGTADAASEGTIGGADLAVRPLLRTAELLEAVPGLIAAQHSGSGKANQYFLRGFNLDHGTDFTAIVDGVPWNLRSHGHGQGYLDVNGLLPEAIERIDYRKGTYRADVGDFSMAGASFISTIERLEQPFVSLEAGDYSWNRFAAGGTSELGGGGLLTGIAEVKGYDGPWELEEGLRHVSAWGKYLRPTETGSLAFTLWGYTGDWHPTEQIPERAIGTAVCADAFCVLDPTAGGETSRWIAGVQFDGAEWRASGYLQYYDWQMLSNPTYDFQINQFDRRFTTGGRAERVVLERSSFEVTAGAELRHDDIGKVGLDHTEGGVLIENVSDNSITETSLGAFVEASWYPTERLRVLTGARADYYDFDAVARSAGSFAGHETDSRVSPKVGVAYTVSDQIELYGNWGRGFHSNDARGVVNETTPVPGLVKGTGYEGGARFEIGAVKLTAAYWWLELDSELQFVGDSNSVEPKGASKRRGYELAAFWRPIDWLGIDAVYTGSRARFVDNLEGPYIDGAVENAGQLGFTAVRDRWEASLRVRHRGEYPLLPDNSLRADAETAVNIRGAYQFGRATVYGEVLNLFDEDGKDIVYYYEAYVPGLDPPGLTSEDIDCSMVNCRMSRAEEPRTLRLGVKFFF